MFTVAEAGAEISAHLPSMPCGGNLMTSKIRSTHIETLIFLGV